MNWVQRQGRQDLVAQVGQVRGSCGHVHEAVYSHEEGQEATYVLVCGQEAAYVRQDRVQ